MTWIMANRSLFLSLLRSNFVESWLKVNIICSYLLLQRHIEQRLLNTPFLTDLKSDNLSMDLYCCLCEHWRKEKRLHFLFSFKSPILCIACSNFMLSKVFNLYMAFGIICTGGPRYLRTFLSANLFIQISKKIVKMTIF